MLPSDFTHDAQDESRANVNTRPSFNNFRFHTTPEPSEYDVSWNHSTAAYSTTELTSRQWMPTPEPMTPVEDKPRSDSTTLCSTPEMSVKIVKGPIVTEQMVEEDLAQEPPPRDFAQNVRAMVFDLVLALASLYFIAFAVVAYIWNDTPASEPKAQALLEAAKIGPTIFPIIFACIIARTFSAVATWRLEHSATVGLLECLMGRRSFASALTSPIKLRTFHIFVPVLILIWAFSPTGGQSALRIVTSEPSNTTNIMTFRYLDTSISELSDPHSLGGVNAAFTAALMSPPASKNGAEDVFGNLQIPMLESIPSTNIIDADGWQDTSGLDNITHVSIFGIPLGGIPDNANSTFTFQTSYFSLACSMEPKTPDTTVSFLTNDPSSGHVSNEQSMAIDFDLSHNFSSTEPRRLGFTSFSSISSPAKVMEARCDLTTTYIEASVVCDTTRSCAVQAVRNSTLDHPPNTLTVLDQDEKIALEFFSAFVNATTATTTGSITPVENYFINPAFPFSPPADGSALADLGDELFSERFAQLLNTYWLANIAPIALLGSFSPEPATADEKYKSASMTGTTTTAQDVLRCHMPWLILLVISSGVMFLASCIAAVLDVMRKGPDVLDDVKATLRGSPFVHVEYGSNVEDKGAVVRLGGGRADSRMSMRNVRYGKGWI